VAPLYFVVCLNKFSSKEDTFSYSIFLIMIPNCSNCSTHVKLYVVKAFAIMKDVQLQRSHVQCI
jgi:hypothetical protein